MGSNSNSAGCHEVWHMAVRADSCAHGTVLELRDEKEHRHSNEFRFVFVIFICKPGIHVRCAASGCVTSTNHLPSGGYSGG